MYGVRNKCGISPRFGFFDEIKLKKEDELTQNYM